MEKKTLSTPVRLVHLYLKNVKKLHNFSHNGADRKIRRESRDAMRNAFNNPLLRRPCFKMFRIFYLLSGVVGHIGDLPDSRSRLKTVKKLSVILHTLCSMHSSILQTLMPDALEYLQSKTAHLFRVVTAEARAVDTLVSISCP